ncbi:hypothetical protein MmiEs2_13400 [Methanimicrococcus stummii]|uniref:Uncharacterized protein n=1 Tax=Methanimicrococcus stummii TaxID=3028294 RepID=A0AA96V992_9EURY|nr:hypothetical protein MmiEs2_13400 [Methanimicrococcus sp. Es2]
MHCFTEQNCKISAVRNLFQCLMKAHLFWNKLKKTKKMIEKSRINVCKKRSKIKIFIKLKEK